MKITFLSPPPNLTGGERVIAIYAKQLIARGHDVQIICSRGSTRTLKRRVVDFWTNSTTSNSQSVRSHYDDYCVPYRIVDHDGPILEKDLPNADIAIATFWITADWLSGFSERKGIKFYLVQHDEGTIHHALGAERTYSLQLHHVYVSTWIADRIRKRHPTSKWTTIPNGNQVELFDCGPRSKPAHLRVGTLWAGDTIKGGDIAVKSVQMVRDMGIEIDFIAFGTSEPTGVYRQCMDQFYLTPNPEMIGEIYSSCSVWLFTSRFEGFGLPILEAMSARTPVIGTSTGAAPEFLKQSNGFLVEVDDVEAIFNAIVEIDTMDETTWQEHSENAWRTACQHSWDASVAFLEQLFIQEQSR